jgi:hypothetical protein
MDTNERPYLTVNLPRDVSDEAALLLLEMMQSFVDEFYSMYWKQIERAEIARDRCLDEFFREEERLARERDFRQRQLNFPFPDEPPF